MNECMKQFMYYLDETLFTFILLDQNKLPQYSMNITLVSLNSFFIIIVLEQELSKNSYLNVQGP